MVISIGKPIKDFYSEGQMTEKAPKENIIDKQVSMFINESYIPEQDQLKASINPKQTVEGIKIITSAVTAITSLVLAGVGLKDAINKLFPNASDKDKAQLADAVNESMKLDFQA